MTAGAEGTGAEGTGSDADLVRLAAELCVVPPEEFVAARTAAAAAADDPALAAAVRRLRKPLLAAWVVNLYASAVPAALGGALGLAEEMRDALASGDARGLSALNARRRKAVRELTDAALERAASHGVQIGPAVRDGVERTLDAAMRDTDAAAAVASARLLRPVEASGMEPPDLDGAVSGPFTVAPGGAAGAAAAQPDDLADRRARRDAERAAREARRRAEQAQHELARAEEGARAARERVGELEERLEALTAERDRVAADLGDARDATEQRAAALAEARAEADAARRAADRAAPGE